MKFLDELAVRWVRRRGLEGRFPPRIGVPGVAIAGNLCATVFRHCILIYSPFDRPASKINILAMNGSMVDQAPSPIADAFLASDPDAAYEARMEGRR